MPKERSQALRAVHHEEDKGLRAFPEQASRALPPERGRDRRSRSVTAVQRSGQGNLQSVLHTGNPDWNELAGKRRIWRQQVAWKAFSWWRKKTAANIGTPPRMSISCALGQECELQLLTVPGLSGCLVLLRVQCLQRISLVYVMLVRRRVCRSCRGLEGLPVHCVAADCFLASLRLFSALQEASFTCKENFILKRP